LFGIQACRRSGEIRDFGALLHLPYEPTGIGLCV
jgi:hypothetical protein